MPLQHYFSYIAVSSAPICAFLEFHIPVTPTHWLLSHINKGSSEKEINTVAMTISILQVEIGKVWLKSANLPHLPLSNPVCHQLS